MRTTSISVAFAALLSVPSFAAADDESGLQVSPGPITGQLGNVAKIEVPAGFSFVEQSQMPVLNKLTGNLHNPNDLGAILSEDGWMVFFTFNKIGYVKDDDRDALNPDEMFTSMKEAESNANRMREEEGYPILTLVGWQTEPYYDSETQNLTWALKNRSGGSEELGINHEVRLLGRRGVMSATLVSGSDALEGAVPKLNTMLKGFSFNSGQKYAEYIQGDKIAEYGLAGLVVGGGVLLAAKSGLLAQLGKFLKFIVIGIVAAFGGIVKMFKRRFNGES